MSPDLIPHALASVAVIWLVTFCLRGFPFVLLRGREDAAPVRMLGLTMPLGVMIILVIFALNQVQFTHLSGWLPSLLGGLVTAVLHWKWSNALLSLSLIHI